MVDGRSAMPPKPTKWRQRRDPLWRGDSDSGLTRPSPRADPSIVRHILFLDGAGRETPYHSTSEVREDAASFARGRGGRVYQTTVAAANASDVRHISKTELIALLQGRGHGAANWPSAQEVMTARRYVEQWNEHLLNYADLPEEADIEAILTAMYT